MRLHSLYTQDMLYIYLRLLCSRLPHLLVLRLRLRHLRAPSCSFVHLHRTLLLFVPLLPLFVTLRHSSCPFSSLHTTFLSSFVSLSLLLLLRVFVSPRVPFGSTSNLQQS